MTGRLHLFDMDRHVKRKLKLDGNLLRTEINWIPLDLNGQLYYTYSLDPLKVMKCDTATAACEFVYQQAESSRHPFIYSSDHLRGGTPWILYKYPYYISVGHNVVVTKYPHDNYSVYNSNIIVMSVEPWRVVYVSRNIDYDSVWMNSSQIIRNQTILKPFFYPCGILLRDADTLDVSGHLNDAAGYILRFRGIKDLMTQIINRDESGNSTTPQVRTIQQYVLDNIKQSHRTWQFFGDIGAGTVESA